MMQPVGLGLLTMLLVVAAFLHDGVRAQPAEDPALVRELAERLLVSSPGIGFLVAVESPRRLPAELPRAELLPGALPAELSHDLPLPPGSRLLGSAIYFRRGNSVSFQTVFDVPTDAGDILEFYEQTLSELGWTVAMPRDGDLTPEGFVESVELRLPGPVRSLDLSREFCRSRQGPSLSVSVVAEAIGVRDVRISGDTFRTRCDEQSASSLRGFRLPLLVLPSGARIVGGSGSSSDGRLATSEAMIASRISIEDLESNFAEQFAAAGWARRDGGVEGLLAWSTWTLLGERDQSGFLVVLAEPDREMRLLRFQARVSAGAPR